MTFQLPPIFADTPEEIFPAKTLGTFPVNTFLENITTDSQGNIFVTSYEEGIIYRLTLQAATGVASALVVQLEVGIPGVVIQA